MTPEEQASVFKALCDEKRIRILALLKNGEQCACVLEEKLDMPQSTLSYHMKILTESGMVTGRQEGKWVHYSINEEGRQTAIGLLEALKNPSSPVKETIPSP